MRRSEALERSEGLLALDTDRVPRARHAEAPRAIAARHERSSYVIRVCGNLSAWQLQQGTLLHACTAWFTVVCHRGKHDAGRTTAWRLHRVRGCWERLPWQGQHRELRRWLSRLGDWVRLWRQLAPDELRTTALLLSRIVKVSISRAGRATRATRARSNRKLQLCSTPLAHGGFSLSGCETACRAKSARSVRYEHLVRIANTFAILAYGNNLVPPTVTSDDACSAVSA